MKSDHPTPAKKTGQANKLAQQSVCFVLMPFSPSFDALYENAIRPAIDQTSTLTCLRADEIYGPRPIMADIWRSIIAATVLIADVTGRNPNVLYELGLAHSQYKPVVIITQNMEDVPFDLRAIRCLVYANDRGGRATLAEKLVRTLSELFPRRRTLKSDYSVLPRLNIPSSEDEPVEIIFDSSDPWRVIASLRARAAQLSSKRPNEEPTQSELDVVLGLLDTSPADVAVEALHFLRDHVQTHQMPLIYPLLDYADPIVRRSVLDLIRSKRDHMAEQVVLSRLKQAIPEERALFIETLAVIAGSATIQSAIATLTTSPIASDSAAEAFRILCANITADGAIDIIAKEQLLDSFVIWQRVKLLDALAAVEDMHYAFDQDFRSATQQIVNFFANDPSPRVLGRVAVLLVKLAKRTCGASVKSSDGWDLVAASNRDVRETFISITTDEDLDILSPEDAVKLVTLAQDDEFLQDRLVFFLHKVGAPGVDDFMLKYALSANEYQLWALAYFASHPAAVAEGPCKTVLASDLDMSHKVLAAVCLAKQEDSVAQKFVLDNVALAYEWVGVLARPVLQDIALHDPTRRRLAEKLLKSIPKTW